LEFSKNEELTIQPSEWSKSKNKKKKA